MKLSDVRDILTRRLSTLSAQKAYAESVGDLDRAATLDAELAETTTTVAQLDAIPAE